MRLQEWTHPLFIFISFSPSSYIPYHPQSFWTKTQIVQKHLDKKKYISEKNKKCIRCSIRISINIQIYREWSYLALGGLGSCLGLRTGVSPHFSTNSKREMLTDHERGAAPPLSGPMLDFWGSTLTCPRTHTDCARRCRRRRASPHFAPNRNNTTNILDILPPRDPGALEFVFDKQKGDGARESRPYNLTGQIGTDPRGRRVLFFFVIDFNRQHVPWNWRHRAFCCGNVNVGGLAALRLGWWEKNGGKRSAVIIDQKKSEVLQERSIANPRTATADPQDDNRKAQTNILFYSYTTP